MTVYTAVLFVHILAAFTLFATTGINLLVLSQLRRAIAVSQVRTLLDLWRVGAAVEPVAALILLAAGGYLAITAWGWQVAWINLALVAVLTIAIGGSLVGGPRVASRTRAASAEPDGPIAAPLAEHLDDPVLWTLGIVTAALEVGVVFLMVSKPDLIGSVAALSVSLFLSLGVAAARRRKLAAAGNWSA